MNAKNMLREFATRNVNCTEPVKILTGLVILAVNDTAEVTKDQDEVMKMAIFASVDENIAIPIAACQIATYINSCR